MSSMRKVHRFLVSNIPSPKTFTIEDNEVLHLIRNVLKLNIGESCIVFSDGGDDYLSKIISFEKKSITLSVQSVIAKKITPKNVTACISIIKKDNFEFVVEKLTELGIKEVIPIITDR